MMDLMNEDVEEVCEGNARKMFRDKRDKDNKGDRVSGVRPYPM